jgi:membrane protein implicated in regulation of membrane protease activity
MGIDMQAVIWLVLLVILLGIEAVTLGLTTIWFAGGALAAFLLSLAGADLLVQLVCFCVVSVILLIFTRPVAVRYLNRDRVQTNASSLIGTAAVVTEEIDNLAGTGQVQVQGQEWTARSTSDELVISSGTHVVIREIRGVRLIVKEEI